MLVEEKVISILSELSGESNISDDSVLQKDLFLDSLAMVTLLIRIEDGFDIQLDESDMDPFNLTTVQNVIDMVKKYKVIDNG